MIVQERERYNTSRAGLQMTTKNIEADGLGRRPNF